MSYGIIETTAYARAGLLGNPTDGYFGKTISIIVRNFGARISLYPSPELQIEPQEQDINVYRNIYHLVDSVKLTGYYGGSRLIKAAIKRFCEYAEERQIRLTSKNFTIQISFVNSSSSGFGRFKCYYHSYYARADGILSSRNTCRRTTYTNSIG